MIESAGSIRAMHPLFQAGDGGSTPTSALQLFFSRMDIRRATDLNRLWHSRLPEITNWQACWSYQGEHSGTCYAVAIWGYPISPSLNGRGWTELRRFAIADDAPKNTASRMLGWMLRTLKGEGRFVKAISYQDTDAHSGTIYRASGWTPVSTTKGGSQTWLRPNIGRLRRDDVATGDKVRWEYDL